MVNNDYAYNPSTNRYVKKTSRTYARLVKSGVIKVESDNVVAPIAVAEPEEPVEPAITPVKKVKKEKVNQKKLQEAIIDSTVDIIAQNRENLVGYSQSELDEIIKIRLYKKLCESSVPAMHIKAVASKDKRRKKPKNKVVFVSSSESESESTE